MAIEEIAAKHGWYWLCKQKLFKHAKKGKRTGHEIKILMLEPQYFDK